MTRANDKSEISMTISVAIATYNRAAMVRQAIEAALGQSLAPCEVVVADDASTDGTRDTLACLAASDARVRVIRQDSNAGGARNANTAMAAARGDLIAWCSDDDRFLPGHLEASAAYLDLHPEVGVVHSGFMDAVETAAAGGFVEARPLRSAQPLRVDRRNMFAYLARYYDWPFHPSTIVMRRQVWEQVGPFDPAYGLTDTDWFVRAAERFSVVLLPRHGVLNRRHPGNWSNRMGSARMQTEIFEIVDRAMLRRWPEASMARLFWRAVWRTNVRLRLLLTIRARIRGGHGDAACASWQALTQATGGRPWSWLERLGVALIRWLAPQAESAAEARQSVSPL
jgi:glycosyltransferase involved in cell wall biosynthesis